MQLPTLYKKTNTGAIQFWTIAVSQTKFASQNEEIIAGLIETTYGQLDTDSPQHTVDTISEGKNPGKKNATTPLQQAEKEAQAKWEKQKKKGYVETIEGAQNEELDALIEGGEEPMLAEAYMDVIYDQRPGHENDAPTYVKTKEAKKIKFPVFTQPKLDGIRCIAIVKNGQATLWSRTRKPINSVPHIIQELEAAFENMDIILDGELYNHDMKSDFEKIVSLVRQKEPGEGHEVVQYHVYDTINGDSFKHRYAQLHRLFRMFEFYSLKLVPTEVAKTEEEVITQFEKNVKLGYEGAMLRNVESEYAQKRSMDLQKMKPFIDDDFLITGVTEGRGKMAGLAIFTCAAKNGNPFEVKLKGELESLRKYMQDESLWKGKKLTVRYFGLTNKEKVPRFPVGIVVRDYE
jgi:ATP-dependent DNA ligase